MSTLNLEEAGMARSRTRMSADERMDQLVSAAVQAFAKSGYAGTTTDQVARLAGVTQPYVIRLFGSKEKLFLAAVRRVCDAIEQAFRDAAATKADLPTLGEGYASMLADRDLLLVFLHGLAAASEPRIGELMRERFDGMCALIGELTGEGPAEIGEFVASGMLLTVLAAMGVVGPEPVPCGPGLTKMIQAFNVVRDKGAGD